MQDLDINKLSYRADQISGLLEALIHEVEPLINRLVASKNLTSEVAKETALELNFKSDSITSPLYVIQDLNYTNKEQLGELDRYELAIEQAIENQDGEK